MSAVEPLGRARDQAERVAEDAITSHVAGDTAALPALVAELASQGWRDQALCAQVGGSWWFPPKGDAASVAKRVCQACPVRADCLDYALGHEEIWGVWGGLGERERHRLARGAA